MEDSNIPIIKPLEVNDITTYAKKHNDFYDECIKVLLFIDENIYWLGKIFDEPRGILLDIIDIHDKDFAIYSSLSAGEFDETLTMVLDDDLENCIVLETTVCSTIEEAEQLFNTKMLEE